MDDLWNFINSSFASWFFPTVVIGSILWSYKILRESYLEKQEMKKIIKEIDLELSYRFYRMKNVLTLERISNNPNVKCGEQYFIRDYIQFNKTNYIVSRLKEESTFGLMLTLASYIDDNKESKEVRQRALNLISLKEKYINSHKPVEVEFEDQLSKIIDQKIFLKRWKFSTS